MEQTGCDLELAHTLLQLKCWDLNGALLYWNELNNVDQDSDQQILSTTNQEQPLPTGTDDLNYKEGNRKLRRGISRATDNLPIVLRARNAIECNLKKNICDQEIPEHATTSKQVKEDDHQLQLISEIDGNKNKGIEIEKSEYTFTLPDLTLYEHADHRDGEHRDEFKQFLENDLIEKSTLISLESSNRLNWWLSYNVGEKLWPLSTNGDGNCLLHAASLSIWGFHDRLLTLRKTLYQYLLQQQSKHDNNKSQLYRRWRYQQTIINKQNSLTLNEQEWLVEWTNIINMASIEPTHSTNSNHYQSLEEIHVLALSIILKRPIIIISNTILNDLNGDPLSPITFGGIYLPFTTHNNYKSPLLLTYNNGHFSSLVIQCGGDDLNNKMIPIVDSNITLLPLQYNYDPGEDVQWNTIEYVNYMNNYEYNIHMLQEYLDTVECNITNSCFPQQVVKQFGSIGKTMSAKLKKNFNKILKPTNNKLKSNIILCCKLNIVRHEYHDDMIHNYIQYAYKRFIEQQLPSTSFNYYECINCHKLTGTSEQCYMCPDCYYLQYHQELDNILNNNNEINRHQYGTGKSKFYTNCHDNSSNSNTSRSSVPSTTLLNPTLYLSKSTFYNDTGTQLFNTNDSTQTTTIT
ncbi:OTU domain-containing protein 7B-like isoform X2 [Chrysoperla carnea]|nr:OTU domain-containing protein 7B-like isoform X2 [Chrysoperla carnea]